MSRADKPCITYMNPGPWPVYIGLCLDERSFNREMKRLGIDDVAFLAHSRAGATTHFLVKGGQWCAIIAMRAERRHSTAQLAALVAHEAVHVVQGMREELSPHSPLGDEAEAYMVQAIVQEMMSLIKRDSKKRRTHP